MGLKLTFEKVLLGSCQFYPSNFRLPVGIPVFGPSALAARMEGDKAFSKAFMDRHSIPTAKFRVFPSSQVDEAIQYVKTCGHKVVLKASGLAAGKGVLMPETVDEAVNGLNEIMVANVFGAAGPPKSCIQPAIKSIYILFFLGNKVVVEELLTGAEISVLAFSDGYSIVPLPAAQDHKRIGEGDIGLNTGGMGAYAPAPIATPAVLDQIMSETLRPTIDGMRKEGLSNKTSRSLSPDQGKCQVSHLLVCSSQGSC
jgi:phosphoribosylamine--glycine ligase/phosphoribosylformylglycinamidine cyclo-ligase